ncbi:unnamed protein product [Chrysoparadoxa australica]
MLEEIENEAPPLSVQSFGSADPAEQDRTIAKLLEHNKLLKQKLSTVKNALESRIGKGSSSKAMKGGKIAASKPPRSHPPSIKDSMALTYPALEKKLRTMEKRIKLYASENEELRRQVDKLAGGGLLTKLKSKLASREQELAIQVKTNKTLAKLQRLQDRKLKQKEGSVLAQQLTSAQEDVRLAKERIRRLSSELALSKQKEEAQKQRTEQLSNSNAGIRAALAAEGKEVPQGRLQAAKHDAAAEASELEALRAEKEELKVTAGQLQKALKAMRCKADHELKSSRAKITVLQREKEELAATVKGNEKEFRLHLFQVRKLKRALRDLATGNMKIQEAREALVPLMGEASLHLSQEEADLAASGDFDVLVSPAGGPPALSAATGSTTFITDGIGNGKTAGSTVKPTPPQEAAPIAGGRGRGGGGSQIKDAQERRQAGADEGVLPSEGADLKLTGPSGGAAVAVH